MDNVEVNQTPQGGAGMSIAAMVLGIVALVFNCCTPYISIPCSIIGIILAALSLKGKKPGRGMAIAGLVCAIIALVLAVVVVATAGAFLEYAKSLSKGA